jgi:hypothetical protein
MPGGRVPKLPEQRRNRTPPRAGEWVRLPASGRRGPVPRLSKSLGLSKATHEWWRAIWHTPMALMWHSKDEPALIELALLRDRFLDGKTGLAPEIRLRSNAFGLTPAGREQRRWLIVDEVEQRADHPDELETKRKRRERLENL